MIHSFLIKKKSLGYLGLAHGQKRHDKRLRLPRIHCQQSSASDDNACGTFEQRTRTRIFARTGRERSAKSTETVQQQ